MINEVGYKKNSETSRDSLVFPYYKVQKYLINKGDFANSLFDVCLSRLILHLINHIHIDVMFNNGKTLFLNKAF